MSKDGGPAFPNEGFNGWGEPQQGMSLRDYFAAKASAGMLTSGDYIGFVENEDYTGLASHAWRLADAMLKVRSK